MEFEKIEYPIDLLINIAKSLGPSDAFFEFSIYTYVEKGETFQRDFVSIKSSDINDKWFQNQILSLNDFQELAIHSYIKIGKKKYHLPLIDFIGDYEPSILRRELSSIRNEYGNIYIFNSGNSYHGYLYSLLSPRKWIDFLGKLLLLNNSKTFKNEITDSRWVGHSLINGYSALRISSNTKEHKIMPYLVEIL